MRIINLTQGTTLAENCFVAESFFARLKGLLGRGFLKDNEALLIRPCNSIHTFFMRFNIDAVFLDRQNKVVALKENLSPFKLTPIYTKAFQVIELPCQKISQTKTELNDLIEIV